MTDSEIRPERDVISFGPFRLIARERLLERDGEAVPLGGRALDLLTVLIRNAPEVVSKKDLLRQVWPDVTVDDSSLRFHVGAVRKALGDGHDGARYVANLPGRGYCFVAPISTRAASPPAARESSAPSHNLPGRLSQVVGREETVEAIAKQILADRFVSVIGPGGIGKTTVAVAVGYALADAFEGGVRFVDLGVVADPALVASEVASTLGLVVKGCDTIDDIVIHLRNSRTLLILDSCEHVIEAAASLAEKVHAQALQVRLLTTSREILRVSGERVHRLAPLGTPPEEAGLTAAQAMTFPAIQMFVERVAASGSGFTLSDADAPIVAGICRRLDGLALAIELAAGKVGTYGIRVTGELLDGQLPLGWRGRRTALPRHKNLAAALDWSHSLLSELERQVLRRLAVFVGHFGPEAAQVVAGGGGADVSGVLEAIANLYAKSLVAVEATETETRYRLLATTRAYALEKLLGSGEADQTRRYHARYYHDFLIREKDTPVDGSLARSFMKWGGQVGNVRTALEWCFGETGDLSMGKALSAAAAPLFLRLGLLAECNHWTERALLALDDASRGGWQEMELQASRGLSLTYSHGSSAQVGEALENAIRIAQSIDHPNCLVWSLAGMAWLHHRTGDYRRKLDYAQRCNAAARDADDEARTVAGATLGVACHLWGRNAEAQQHLEDALARPASSAHANALPFAFDHRNRARVALARCLWIRGFADQAIDVVRHAVADAVRLDHPVTLRTAIGWSIPLFLWIGDNRAVEQQLVAHAEAERRHPIPFRENLAGVWAVLAIRQGRLEEGLAVLRPRVAAMRNDQFKFFVTVLNTALAPALAATGRFDEAISEIDGAIAWGEEHGHLLAMPDMLRLKAEILAVTPGGDARQVEAVLLQSLELARSQAAVAWELRTATSLARHWAARGHAHDAVHLLAPVYARFTEGFGTPDLRAARQLLDELSGTGMPEHQRAAQRVQDSALKDGMHSSGSLASAD